MKTIIKFGVSLLAPPFFNANIDQMGHIEIEGMGLPKDLENSTKEWNQRYQNTYCDEYPLILDFIALRTLMPIMQKAKPFVVRSSPCLAHHMKFDLYQ